MLCCWSSTPKGRFTPTLVPDILQEKRKDNSRQRREDEALTDKEEGYDREGWKQFETGKINRKKCSEENRESDS